MLRIRICKKKILENCMRMCGAVLSYRVLSAEEVGFNRFYLNRIKSKTNGIFAVCPNIASAAIECLEARNSLIYGDCSFNNRR